MPDKPKFNQEQYDLLVKCSAKKDMAEWNDHVHTILPNIHLEGANFKDAYLRGVNLTKASCRGAVFRKADLSEANLTDTKLQWSNLVATNLKKTILTGTNLYGTARENWVIDRIACNYVYWDNENKERTPKSRSFHPGEFEELYKSLPTITYYFSDNFTPITLLIMDKVVKEINQKHPQFELKLDSFDLRDTPHAIFTVLHKDHSDKALNEITHEYEKTSQRLEGKIEALKEIVSGYIDKPQLIQNAETIIHNPGRTYHMGNTFGNINSGRDTNIATNQGTVNVNQDAINLIDKTITESCTSLDDKEDAKEQLDKIVQELGKPEPDKGRIKRCYDYVVGVIPKVAEVVPWGKLIEKTLGL